MRERCALEVTLRDIPGVVAELYRVDELVGRLARTARGDQYGKCQCVQARGGSDGMVVLPGIQAKPRGGKEPDR
jgi:hypothetical protein